MPAPLADLGDVASRIWSDLTSAQQPPSDAAIWATAAAALLLVVVPSIWRHARHLVTIAHEGAHAFVALLMGRRLRGIKLNFDTSGLATSIGRARGPGIILMTFAGYPGPALLGLGAALLLGHGHALAVLWIGVILLALMLLQIRNAWGVVTVVGSGAAVFAVSWWASEPVQSWVAYAATWFLLLAAPRPVFELQRARSRGRASGSDADVLARLTPLPGLFWVGAFLVVTVGALILGAQQLLP